MKVVTVGHALACPLTPIFQHKGWDLTATKTLEEALSAIRSTPTPIVIVDRDLAGPDWRPIVRSLAAQSNSPCVILASHVVDDYLLEEVIQHGGYDVIAKPFREQEVTHAIEFAWSATKSRLSSRRTR
jgi:two-component system, OmpR family, response regulator